MVTSSAYLLFYRRRSVHPLGGKALREITESFKRDMDDPESSANPRASSPSGEGRRLGGFSRNGSSSALAGVGAAHQAGVGGVRAGTQAKNGDNESPPGHYQNRQEGMLLDDEDDEDDGGVPTQRPWRFENEPSWSFGTITEAHGPSQRTGMLPLSESSDDEVFDDDAASDRAVGGDNMSDSDMQLASLTDDHDEQHGVPLPGTPKDEAPSIQDIPPPLDADDDDELPVVELRVNDDDQTNSD